MLTGKPINLKKLKKKKDEEIKKRNTQFMGAKHEAAHVAIAFSAKLYPATVVYEKNFAYLTIYSRKNRKMCSITFHNRRFVEKWEVIKLFKMAEALEINLNTKKYKRLKQMHEAALTTKADNFGYIKY